MEKKFTPKPGQVDYTNIRRAPVINCVLRYGDKILLVKRSAELRLYPNYWNGISGFLDDDRSVLEKVKDEIREETGIVIPKGVPIYYLGSTDGENEQDSTRMFCQNFFFCELPNDMDVELKSSIQSEGEEEFVKDFVWLPAKDGMLVLGDIRVSRNHLPAFGRAIRNRFYARGSR